MAVWQGFQPKVVDVFGGLVTNVDRNDLGGVMVSPNCQDVEFTVGSVHSRRGSSLFKDLGATVGAIPCTAMFADWQPSMGPVTVCYFSSNTGAAVGDGWFAAVDISGNVGTNKLGPLNTYTVFGGGQFSRFWMGFPTAASAGFYGTSETVPRVFDYNGVTKFYQAGLPQPAVNTIATSKVASVGNTVDAGVHYFRVTFEGIDGSLSAVSAPFSFNMTAPVADSAIQIDNIPTGPPSTVRRVIWATTVADGAIENTQSYYTIRSSSMVIPDNTTTTATVAFTDSALGTGETASSNALFTLMRPPPAKGVVFYKNRAFWFHLLGAVQQSYINLTNIPNTEWDSDSSAFVASRLRGWTAGSQFAVIQTASSSDGCNLLRITADGSASYTCVSGRVSMATSPSASSAIPTFTKGKKYGVCFRARRGTNAFSQGSLNFISQVTSGAATYTISAATLTTAWQTFYTGTLLYNFDYTTAANNPGITISMTGTPTAGAYVEIEPLVFYDSGNAGVADGTKGNAWQGSLVLASKPFYPGTCDGATGLQLIARDDGEHINAGFVFRDNLYFVKNHSMYVTADNGVTEPGGWTIQNVSKVAGTYSPAGVAVGDSFVIIAGSDGVYYFDGGAPEKISQEITPTWNRIPTARLYEISVTINQVDKQIIFNVPLDNETTASHQIVLDYTEGFGDPLAGNGHGRKWTIWTTAGSPTSCAFMSDWGFTNVPFLLLGTQNGLLLKQDSAQTTDNASGYTSFYETAPVGYGGPGVSYFGGLIFNANGTSMDVSYTVPLGTNTGLGTFALTNPMTRVTQIATNISTESIGVRMGGTSKWSVNNVWIYTKAHPYFNVRGLNP